MEGRETGRYDRKGKSKPLFTLQEELNKKICLANVTAQFTLDSLNKTTFAFFQARETEEKEKNSKPKRKG